MALLGYGYGAQLALDAAALLEEHGLGVTVADARFAKPVDEGLIERLAAEHELLVTIEENVLAGGFGSGVLEHVEDAFAGRQGERAQVMRVGLPTVTSPTESRRCCARRSGSPAQRSPSGSPRRSAARDAVAR